MPVIVNDLMLEPKAMPPMEAETKSSGGGGGSGAAPAAPDVERQIRQIECRSRERALRLWAH